MRRTGFAEHGLRSTVLNSPFISDYFLFSNNKKLLFDVAKKWLLTFQQKNNLFARFDDLRNKIHYDSSFRRLIRSFKVKYSFKAHSRVYHYLLFLLSFFCGTSKAVLVKKATDSVSKVETLRKQTIVYRPRI